MIIEGRATQRHLIKDQSPTLNNNWSHLGPSRLVKSHYLIYQFVNDLDQVCHHVVFTKPTCWKKIEPVLDFFKTSELLEQINYTNLVLILNG